MGRALFIALATELDRPHLLRIVHRDLIPRAWAFRSMASREQLPGQATGRPVCVTGRVGHVGGYERRVGRFGHRSGRRPRRLLADYASISGPICLIDHGDAAPSFSSVDAAGKLQQKCVVLLSPRRCTQLGPSQVLKARKRIARCDAVREASQMIAQLVLALPFDEPPVRQFLSLPDFISAQALFRRFSNVRFDRVQRRGCARPQSLLLYHRRRRARPLLLRSC